MSVSTFTKRGVRYRCVATTKSRWSEGKVHLQIWSREHRDWVLACRPSDAGTLHSYNVAQIEPTEVTCRSCLKRDPR